MTELLGRVPTIPIPIFNGIQKFRLASSSIQVFIQMISGHCSDLILKNLVKGHIGLPYATTMLKQTNLEAILLQNQVKGQVFNVLPNNW